MEKEKWKYENLRQEEIIFNLSGELKELVKEQTAVYNDTKTLHQSTEKHGVTRRDLIAIRRIGSRQKKLMSEIDKIMQKLEKEDSQVFNWILRRIRVNMDETIKNLRRRDMGILTQSLQKEAIDRMSKLLVALKEEQDRRKKQNQQQQQQQQQEDQMQQRPRILPTIAELKMIKDIQIEIKDKTQRLFNNIKDKKVMDSLTRKRLERLGYEEGDLAEMTKRFIESLEGVSGGN